MKSEKREKEERKSKNEKTPVYDGEEGKISPSYPENLLFENHILKIPIVFVAKSQKIWESRIFWSSPYRLLKFREIFIFFFHIHFLQFWLPNKIFIKIGETCTQCTAFENSSEVLKMKLQKCENCLTTFSWHFEFGAAHNLVNLVDLVKSFHSMSLFLDFFSNEIAIQTII